MTYIRTGQPARSGGGRHPLGPFLEWVDGYAKANGWGGWRDPRAKGVGDVQDLAFDLNLPDRTLRRWRDGECKWVSGDLVDRVFTHLGTPEVYWDLYPMEEAGAA